jgi:hypothetical protein
MFLAECGSGSCIDALKSKARFGSVVYLSDKKLDPDPDSDPHYSDADPKSLILFIIF